MKLRNTLVATMLCVAASLSLAACEKKSDSAAAPGAGSAAAPATAAATAAAAPGAAQPGATAVNAAVTAQVGPGGTVVAANNHGVVTVNDAGVVTARRENGDKVVTNPNGVTNANGVVVDSKKGTVVVPGVGTFATPPH